MARQIVIRDTSGAGTFLASSSGTSHFDYAVNTSEHSITLTYTGDSTADIKIHLAQDPDTREYIANSLMLSIKWGTQGTEQTVVYVHDDAYEVSWKYGNRTLTPGNPSVVVQDDGVISCTPSFDSGVIPSQTVTEVTIAGYWKTNVNPDANTGCYNNCAIWKLNTNYTISWKKPQLNTSDVSIVGYLIVYWKGEWQPGYHNTIGDMVMVGANTTSYISKSDWFNSAEGHKIKHTVFTIYNKGMSPKMSVAQSQTESEWESSTIADYSAFMLFDASHVPELRTVSFYQENGQDLIVIDGVPQTSSGVLNESYVSVPESTAWIPENYHLIGWQERVDGGQWESNVLSNAEVNQILITTNLDFRAVLAPNTLNITYINSDDLTQQIIDQKTIGIDYSILDCTWTKPDYIFSSWNTAIDGSGDSYLPDQIYTLDTPLTLYTIWRTEWDYDEDIDILWHKRPELKLGAKRTSLEKPSYVTLVINPELHPIITASGINKNFVSQTSDIQHREETAENRWHTENTWNGTTDYEDISSYDPNYYPDWTDEDTPITQLYRTDVCSNASTKARTEFNINQEYHLKAKIVDGLLVRSTYTQNAQSVGLSGNKSMISPNNKFSAKSDWSNVALLLKYITKLLVHNPFMDEVLKESRELEIVNNKPHWNKQWRQPSIPPETDYWQLREHIQENINSADEINRQDNIISLLEMRSNEMSVNGFENTELDNYIIPTLKRELIEDENLVYDKSQFEVLLRILDKINSSHSKIDAEREDFENRYKEVYVGESQEGTSPRIMDLDGERHALNSLYNPTESDVLENRVRDTQYKEVELRNFENGRTENIGTSTDHIYDYDISEIDMERSLSDFIYILSRMSPRAKGSEGSKADFNDLSLDSSNKSQYWDEDNNRFKDIAFTNWIPSTQSWREEENKITDYTQYDELVGYHTIRPDSSDEFMNNGCRAACMGLCTSGCYQTCVGGCNTACGTSCFFGCKNSCSGTCGGQCDDKCLHGCKNTCYEECNNSCGGSCTGCGGTCTGVCEGTCELACYNACQGVCSNTCTGNCGNNCQSGCQSGCKTGCTGTCNTSCTNNCQNNCGSGCENSCSGTCSKGCTGHCSQTCEGECTGGCHLVCTNGCGFSCSTDCSGTCNQYCSGSCNSTCNQNCSTKCYSGCTGECEQSCNSGCKLGCKQTCNSSCSGQAKISIDTESGESVTGCRGTCAAACSSNCYTACGYQCGSSCTNECMNGCDIDCGGLCKGTCTDSCTAGCASWCYGACTSSCTQICTTACQMTCGGLCMKTCTDTCYSTCLELCATTCLNMCLSDCYEYCSRTCIDQCSGDCFTSCYNACINSCKNEGCKIECGSQCAYECITGCSVQCGNSCSYSCFGVCGQNCKGDCKFECHVTCQTVCDDTCLSECDHNCGNGCGFSCGSQCSSGCKNKCKTECSTNCTTKCDNDCNKFCKTTCNETCENTCVGGCWSSCGKECNSSCKNGCTTGCHTSCKTGCSNKCENSCDNNCNSNCSNGCLSACEAICKGSCEDNCGSDCTGTCAGGCNTTCVGECSEECGSGCDSSCNTSCSLTCQGSCHTACTGAAFKLVSA